MILVDSGPLVAWVTPQDPDHQRCNAQARQILPPLYTTAPVITETCWLIRQYPASLAGVRWLLSSRFIKLYPFDGEQACWMLDFIAKYQNIKADFADASLMYIAEHEEVEAIFTLDRRDFSVYRTSKNRALKIVP